jgi:hypothetical protein
MENKINYIDSISGRKPTEKQLEVLLLLNPFVKKINYSEVARILGISRAGVQQRMSGLKRRCPSIYKKFWDLKKAMSKGQQAINKAYVADPNSIEDLNALDKIRETF